MIRLLATLVVAVALGFTALSSHASTFSGVTFFGDSLIDDGKLGASGPPPPFLDGRFTNGPTYAEIVGSRFTSKGLGYLNLGLGGATAGDVNTNPYPSPAIPFTTFNNQINTFLALSPLVGPDPLLSVALGANDIFQAGNDPLLTPQQSVGAKMAAAASAAQAAVAGIDRLFNTDMARFDDFFILSMPNLGATPDGSATPDAGKAISDTYNATLFAGLAQFQSNVSLLGKSVNLILFDSDAFQAALMADAAAVGLVNFTDSCIDNFASCSVQGINTYAFIDGVHPTAPVQAALASAFIDRLGDRAPPAVPVPAGLPLLMTAGALLLGLRRGVTRP